GEDLPQTLGVGEAVVLEGGDIELTLGEAVGEIVDDADRRVFEAELAGDDALGGEGHPAHVGGGGDQADLGRGLEAGPERLPVDAAVAGWLAAVRPGLEHLDPPAWVEAR